MIEAAVAETKSEVLESISSEADKLTRVANAFSNPFGVLQAAAPGAEAIFRTRLDAKLNAQSCKTEQKTWELAAHENYQEVV